jgi:SAM-dependent methyltransferase
MKAFWDARAREEPYYFIDDRRAYGDPELAAFWNEGERDLDRLLSLLHLRIAAEDDVLEIGCGVGRLTRPIAARASSVHALDVSGEMLERGRRHHPSEDNIRWVLGDGHSLAPIGDGAVDAVISHVVFQHIPDPRVTLGYVAEIGRVLRPGGWAAFQVSNDPQIHRPRRSPRDRLRRARAAAGRGPQGQHDPAWLGSAVELDELRFAAGQAGLALERIVGEGTQFCLIAARRHAPPRSPRSG